MVVNKSTVSAVVKMVVFDVMFVEELVTAVVMTTGLVDVAFVDVTLSSIIKIYSKVIVSCDLAQNATESLFYHSVI